MEQEVWLIIGDGKIKDVHTSKEVAEFLAGDGDHVKPYTIKVDN